MRGVLGISAISVVCGCAASPPPAVAPSLPAPPERSLDVFERVPSPREIIPPHRADNWRAMQAPDPPAPTATPPAKADAKPGAGKPPVVPAPVLSLSPIVTPVARPEHPDETVIAAGQCRGGANTCETATSLTPVERGTCHYLCGEYDYDRIAESALASCVESVARSWGVQIPVCTYALPAAPSPEKTKLIERLMTASPTCEKTCWDRARVIWNRELDPLDVKSGGL